MNNYYPPTDEEDAALQRRFWKQELEAWEWLQEAICIYHPHRVDLVRKYEQKAQKMRQLLTSTLPPNHTQE
jgi:hypothetical protein